jgi:vacuolar-type H+-ATPase subunit F/Vma7
MSATIFIGDELTAAGFRLTGVETMTPAPGTARRALADARRRAAFVIVTADICRHVPPSELQAALLAETPILAIIPDILSRVSPPDLERRLRVALGGPK